MSYAQMDPLVIYKKESFEKFQELLANIINSTSSYLLKIDFEAIASQQIAAQLVQDQDNQEKVIEILSSASRDF
jgi:preprotein translocase subunit SecA